MSSSTDSPFRLDEHLVFITGATQGVGASIAKAVCRAGADVIIHGLRDDDHARQTLQECRSLGSEATLVIADLMRPVSEYLQAIETQLPDGKSISCLVHNAGTYIDVPFLQMDEVRFRNTFDLNVTSGFFLVQHFARQWVESGFAGRVVLTGSINGFLAEPDHVAYDASKGAVAAMVRSLCVSLAPHDIRVNSMAPGLVVTPLTQVVEDDPTMNAWMKLHTPNGSVPGPEVCGDTVVYLLSDAARHVHGQTILVDGGMSVWQQPDPPKDA